MTLQDLFVADMTIRRVHSAFL